MDVCEHSNEALGFMKGRQFLERLSGAPPHGVGVLFCICLCVRVFHPIFIVFIL